MEALSELLGLIRLNVAIYHNALVCGNWRLQEKELGITCFHMVTLGDCKMEVPGHLTVTLKAGDLVIFPQELAHTMEPIAPAIGPQLHLPYHKATEQNGTGLLCGEVRFQHHASQQLMAALPPVLIIANHTHSAWLAPLITLLIEESLADPTGKSVIIDRLSELVFMYALRHHIHTNRENMGVLSLYAHPRLSLAINALHKNPEQNWTLINLAKHAAQSRTQFAKTFKAVSGFTAMEYLTWWRMQLAWRYLSDGETVARVAEKIGYQSESSFLRAFKKTFHLNAGKVRKHAS